MSFGGWQPAWNYLCVYELCKSREAKPIMVEVTPALESTMTMVVELKVCVPHRTEIIRCERTPGAVLRMSREGWLWVDDLLHVIFGKR